MKSKFTGAMFRLLAAIITGIFICADAYDARANVVTVNFDALDASGGQITGTPLTSYLAGYGITLSVSGASASVGIASDNLIYGGGDIGATTGHNVLLEGGGHPVSFTLSFANPLSSFQFDRVSSILPNSFPTWSATAYDLSNSVLSTVGESPQIGTFAATTFVLTGADISSVTFSGNDFGVYGFANEPIDTLVLTSATPLPAALPLFASGLGALGLLGWRRKRKAAALAA
jgi:hypothetical protein